MKTTVKYLVEFFDGKAVEIVGEDIIVALRTLEFDETHTIHDIEKLEWLSTQHK